MTPPASPSWQPELILVIKLFLLATALAVGIRTLGPSLPLAPTTPVVLSLVLLPTLIMASLFVGRWQRLRS